MFNFHGILVPSDSICIYSVNLITSNIFCGQSLVQFTSSQMLEAMVVSFTGTILSSK